MNQLPIHHAQLRSLAEVESERNAIEEDSYRCANWEYTDCQNRVAEDGDRCNPCEAEYSATAAYWKRQYDREPRYSRAEVEDCYSEPCERNKRERMLMEVV